MFLEHRFGVLQDGEPFYNMFFSNHLNDDALRACVLYEFQKLVPHPATLTMVVEDLEQPVGDRMVGMAQLLFVSNDFVAWAHADMPPHAVYFAARTMPDGSAPLLSAFQIRETNSEGGLNAFIARWAWDETRYSRLEQQSIHEFMYQSFMVYARQYQYKEVLVAATGEIAYQRCLGAGYHLINDHSAFYSAHPLEPGELAAYILGLSREQAELEEGTLASLAFGYRPPKFFFSALQQEVLELAVIGGMSDAEICRRLQISGNVVRQRLRAVYARVDQVMPELLPQSTKLTRGSERRSLLIRYLHSHVEEVRPVNRPHIRERSKATGQK